MIIIGVTITTIGVDITGTVATGGDIIIGGTVGTAMISIQARLWPSA